MSDTEQVEVPADKSIMLVIQRGQVPQYAMAAFDTDELTEDVLTAYAKRMAIALKQGSVISAEQS